MSNTEIISQEHVQQMLAGAVEVGRVSHAYLFYGPDGTGKRAMAIRFSAALLCSNRISGRACLKCGVCDRVLKLIHPDLHFLLPTPGDSNESSVAGRLRILAEDPYAVVDFERKPTLDGSVARTRKRVIYSVDQIHRDVHKSLSFTAAEGGYRIVVLTDADRMTVQAANALLKVLEEPRPRTILILATDQPDLLLPTIRSRCQSVRFDRLTDREISDALESRTDLDSTVAMTHARIADGSLGRALELALSEEMIELRARVVTFLRTAYSCKAPEVVKFAEELQRMSREQLRFFYQLVLIWLRDIVLQRMFGAAADLVNLDQREAIAKFSDNLPHAKIDDMIEAVEEAYRLVDRNINPRLGLIVLSTTLSEAMRGQDGGVLGAAGKSTGETGISSGRGNGGRRLISSLSEGS